MKTQQKSNSRENIWRLYYCLATLLLMIWLPAASQAAPGDLDPSFGNGGKVITKFGGGNSSANAAAVQPDGKIVAVGSTNLTSGVGGPQTCEFVLSRYNTNGSLDTAFGTGGTVVTAVGNRVSVAFAVAIQSDGKIVAAGYSSDIGEGLGFALVRYNADGSLDTSFGNGGKVITPDNRVFQAVFRAVAIQPDGKIIAAGTHWFGFDDFLASFALMRYNTNGSLDTSFGTGGIVTTQFSNSNEPWDEAFAVAIQSDGKVVAAGSGSGDANKGFALARYNTNGSLDTSFGTGGKVVTPINSGNDKADAVAIQLDGKIVVAGNSWIGNSNNFALARYNTNGSLDTTFGTGGIVVTPIGNDRRIANAVAIQSNGKIVVAGGNGRWESNLDFALARYSTDGSLDTSFGSGGIVVTPIGNGNEWAIAVAIQPDGRIVAVGNSNNGTNGNFALVQYLGDSASANAPPNDDFANAQVISGSSGSVKGTNVGASAEAGDPMLYGASVWYRWQAPATGNVTFNTLNSDFDTVISMYTGDRVDALTFLAGNDDFAGLTSSITVSVTAGTIYHIEVDGYIGETGNITLNWSLDTPATSNPIDEAQFFVRQHYRDFLSREPDSSGLAFWTNEITSCGGDAQCIEAKRVNVSAAYFLSIEFQQTGYLVYRIYKSSYGNLPNAPVPVKFSEFTPDTQQIGQGVIVNQTGWEQKLENNKQAFATEFVQRSRFTSAYPTSLTPDQFVDTLFANAGVIPSAGDRAAAISEFASATTTNDATARARALRRVAENSTLTHQEFNRAFVLMQYFGYLRRNPNDLPDSNFDGYYFWLNKLDQFNGNYINAEMVKAFIVSIEYRQRFGP